VRAPARDAREPGARQDDASASASPDGAALDAPPADDLARAAPEPFHDDEPAADGQLFPPGPLARVKLVPGGGRLPPDVTRTFRARALDADGRSTRDAVTLTWHLDGPGELAVEPAAPDVARFTAPSSPGFSTVRVHAASGPRHAEALAELETSLELLGREKVGGIPEPRPIAAPGEPWRSRLRAEVWEYNESHPDYRTAAETDAGRLRYLIHLFAKEIVLRNFGRPGDGDLLERLVQVLTHLTPANRR
jgi:hypothetical protein